jgi:hypothetical protein
VSNDSAQSWTTSEDPAPTPVCPSSPEGGSPPQTVGSPHKKFPISKSEAFAAPQDYNEKSLDRFDSIPDCDKQQFDDQCRQAALLAERQRCIARTERILGVLSAATLDEPIARMESVDGLWGMSMPPLPRRASDCISPEVVNRAGILGSDVPHVVIEKLEKALDAQPAATQAHIGPYVIGVDPARDEDAAVITIRKGDRVLVQYTDRGQFGDAVGAVAERMRDEVRMGEALEPISLDAERWADSLQRMNLSVNPNDFGYIFSWYAGDGLYRTVCVDDEPLLKRASQRAGVSDVYAAVVEGNERLTNCVAVELFVRHGSAFLAAKYRPADHSHSPDMLAVAYPKRDCEIGDGSGVAPDDDGRKYDVAPTFLDRPRRHDLPLTASALAPAASSDPLVGW